jgi:hypothetical protein
MMGNGACLCESTSASDPNNTTHVVQGQTGNIQSDDRTVYEIHFLINFIPRPVYRVHAWPCSALYFQEHSSG